MTRDDAIKALRYERKTALHENKSAFDMAIQALEQQKVKEIQGIMEGGWTVTFEVPEIEPCDDATLKDIFCMGCEYREQEPTDHIEYGTDGNAYKLWMSNGKEFACDDAISREAVLGAICDYVALEEYEDKSHTFTIRPLTKRIKQLPSVTQKSGKWDRLYSWLNDMRFGIAPDETVTDIDERNCRESQTDILDEIMEWMIKAESEE